MMIKKYRDIGFKLTPQRLAILDYLEGNRQHPSAEDIYRAVLKAFPTISFATVYTTLAALKQKGKLLELSTDPSKKRYDPDTSCHSHLLCLSCKRVFDMPGEHAPILPESVRKDFEITRSHVEFHGMCAECKKSNAEKSKEADHVR
jgi:Fur family transcriptional regulator, peroxide stress response regulator